MIRYGENRYAHAPWVFIGGSLGGLVSLLVRLHDFAVLARWGPEADSRLLFYTGHLKPAVSIVFAFFCWTALKVGIFSLAAVNQNAESHLTAFALAFVVGKGERAIELHWEVMQPWFIATETFTPLNGEAWEKYIAWSGLVQLEEVVSLDGLLCPAVLRDIDSDDWPYIVNEDFMLHFFVDLEYLRKKISQIPKRNLLCVYRDPVVEPPVPEVDATRFEFLGYDLVEVGGSISALTNCGGFPDVFDNRELSSKGLLTSHDRACRVQSELRRNYPGEHHANCHVWAVFEHSKALHTTATWRSRRTRLTSARKYQRRQCRPCCLPDGY